MCLPTDNESAVSLHYPTEYGMYVTYEDYLLKSAITFSTFIQHLMIILSAAGSSHLIDACLCNANLKNLVHAALFFPQNIVVNANGL